jgi:general secretion pathway protein H
MSIRRLVAASAPRRCRRGFSLVETLVVLAVLASMASIAGLSLQSVREQALVRRTATELADLLGKARDGSIRSGAPRHVVLDTATRSAFVREDGQSIRLHRTVSVSLTSAREVSTRGLPTVLFLPDGTGSGGSLQATNGKSRATVRISWLTGIIDVEL